MPPLQMRGGCWLQIFVARHPMAPPQGACGRGSAPVPNSRWGRGLSERSEFRSPNLSGLGQRHPKGRARAPMVLDPFAETKGSRRAGATPRILSLVVRGRNPAFFPPRVVLTNSAGRCLLLA